MTSVEKVCKAALERLEATSHALQLPASQLASVPHVLFGSDSF